MTDDEKRTARRAIEREIHRATGGAKLAVRCGDCRAWADLLFDRGGNPGNLRRANRRPYCAKCFARLNTGR
jgi:hypothetical protein